MRSKDPLQKGFTIIELVVVLVIVGILGTLVTLTYSGVRVNNRNADRQANIDTLQSELEAYYAERSKYPTLAELNNEQWRGENMKSLNAGVLKDPRFSEESTCATDKKATLAGAPTENCFSYEARAGGGEACDNDKAPCAHYTLTAMLEGGEKYVKTSLN